MSSPPPVLSNSGGRLSHPWLPTCVEMLRASLGAALLLDAPLARAGCTPSLPPPPSPGAYSEAETLPLLLRLAPARTGLATL